jgi:hypothetical protein
MKKIIQNSVTCEECGDNIWSSHRHDYRQCVCGAIAVDGGMDYLRRVGNGAWKDTSLSMEKEHIEELIKSVEWAKENKRNSFGTALAVIRALREHGYLNEEKFK